MMRASAVCARTRSVQHPGSESKESTNNAILRVWRRSTADSQERRKGHNMSLLPPHFLNQAVEAP
jgi:hypothetical protein